MSLGGELTKVKEEIRAVPAVEGEPIRAPWGGDAVDYQPTWTVGVTMPEERIVAFAATYLQEGTYRLESRTTWITKWEPVE
jgi:hypothetical protein